MTIRVLHKILSKVIINIEIYSKQSGIPASRAERIDRARNEHAEHIFSYVSSANERSNNAGQIRMERISKLQRFLLHTFGREARIA